MSKIQIILFFNTLLYFIFTIFFILQIGCLIKTVEFLKAEVRTLAENSRKVRHVGRFHQKRFS